MCVIITLCRYVSVCVSCLTTRAGFAESGNYPEPQLGIGKDHTIGMELVRKPTYAQGGASGEESSLQSLDTDEDGADVADDGSGTGSDGEESGEKGASDEGVRGGVSHKGLRKASTTQSSSRESALRFTPQMVRTPIALCCYLP